MDTEQAAPDHAGAQTTRGSTGGTVRRLISQATTLIATVGVDDVSPEALHLGRMGDADAVRFARDIESLARLLAALQVQAAAELADRVAAGRFESAGAPTTALFLADALRISTRDAAARLSLGEAVLAHTDPYSFDRTPAPRPILAEAFLTGTLGRDVAAVIVRHTHAAQTVVGTLKPSGTDGDQQAVTEEDVTRLESVLTHVGGRERPEVVDQCGRRALAHLDPDGDQPGDGELRDKEGLHFGRPRRGMISISGHLTVTDYEQLMASIGHATSPRRTGDSGKAGAGPVNPEDSGNPDGPGNESTAADGADDPGCGLFDAVQPETGQAANNPILRDERTRAQKLLHEMMDCVRLAAATDTLPDNGGLRPQIHVTVTLEALKTGLGTAHVPFAGEMPASQIRHLACDADIIPIVMNSKGAVLDEGRRQRLVTPAIRRALVARDHGCAFPGCPRPPQWTEAHHIVPWSEGGPTSVANCVILCGWHHHLLHRTDWEVDMVDGIPWFTPPPARDPLRHRIRNLYWNPPDP
ncbi:HNH endonuclease signature motif containing protein [Specibacter cremeus]|uniref:HNH endonuclease signature motif containing protein n=1 Tax=Specibacter cremeus TaxID=1629051 RepID=UPI000F7ABA29|nr:HNH endonuclease signature motif containing protein [Specibacter cremeus]